MTLESVVVMVMSAVEVTLCTVYSPPVLCCDSCLMMLSTSDSSAVAARIVVLPSTQLLRAFWA